jgi:hypothetical protein
MRTSRRLVVALLLAGAACTPDEPRPRGSERYEVVDLDCGAPGALDLARQALILQLFARYEDPGSETRRRRRGTAEPAGGAIRWAIERAPEWDVDTGSLGLECEEGQVGWRIVSVRER